MIVGMTMKKENLFWFNSQQLASLDGLIRCSKTKKTSQSYCSEPHGVRMRENSDPTTSLSFTVTLSIS